MFAKKKKVTKDTKASTISEREAKLVLKANKKQAEELLQNEEKMNSFLAQLDRKFNAITGLKDKFDDVPIIIQLIKDYISGRYRTIPLGTIIALICALIYFLSPVGVIPDVIPGIGYLDDLTVIGLAVKFASTDFDDYKEWLKKNKS
ncbi:YkvA family protein [Brotaphodocola sp.]|uniref:YkvA family protein n=1 Tax=Brotaphodocola sp. TaxID=3073577 RepID=UPI003D7E1B03